MPAEPFTVDLSTKYINSRSNLNGCPNRGRSELQNEGSQSVVVALLTKLWPHGVVLGLKDQKWVSQLSTFTD